MASLVETQWQRLLENRTALFQKEKCENILAVYDEASFRLHFEDICKSYKEPATKTLLARLQASFRRAEPFRELLDVIRPTPNVQSPQRLMWGACFAVVEVSKC